MKTTINYIQLIKQGDKLLSLITDKPLKIKGLLSTQKIVLPLSFNYKVVDIATDIKSCYENYTKGNAKYIFYIYVSIKGNVVYMIYDLIPRKELKSWYKMKIIIPMGKWVTALEIMNEIKKLFDEEVKKNVNDMQIFLDKKSYDCLRRNNTVSFHINGSFYTLSYSKRKSLCSLSRYGDDGKKYFVGIFEYPICLEYQEELNLKKRKEI